MSGFIPLSVPNFGEKEAAYAAEAITSGWVSTSGAKVSEFEEALAAYVGMPRAVAANSGTSSLHLAAMAAGIRRGDEVIVPTLTFIAAVNPLTRYVGADQDRVICPLSVVDGEEPVIGMTLTLAFVNPFSENKEAAIEYLEDAWDANGRTNRILMNPNDNEPVVNAYYEQNLKEIQNNIDQQKKSLETMTDEETRERSELYAQYIREFREQTEATLKRVRVEQEDGSYKPLVKKEKKLN